MRPFLLGYEQHTLACLNGGCNHVGNRLGFAGSGRPLNDQVPPSPGLFDHQRLRTIGIQDVNHVDRTDHGVDLVVVPTQRRLVVEAVPQNRPDDLMLFEFLVLGPVLGLQIPVHQELPLCPIAIALNLALVL